MTDANKEMIIETGEDTLSIKALAEWGEGKLAYLKPIKSDDLGRIFPGAPDVAPGLNLFVLLAANGMPIMITDSRDTAMANAWEHDLETVSLH
ncbi:MAG: hypothetical protein RLZ07_455 [Pseudomonadota bacterium]|jgi:hypothetical protein|nr:DUF1150 domain-containing protein [Alphaproteobacteria bacterium]